MAQKSLIMGGEFSREELEANPKALKPSFEHFFPLKLHGLERSHLLSGADSLAYLIIQATELLQNPNPVLYTPTHYCEGALSRALAKLNFKVQVERYTVDRISKFKAGSIVVYAHFNRYSNIDHLKKIAELSSSVLIEDFTMTPFDLENSTSKFAFASLRKFALGEISVTYTAQVKKVPIQNSEESLYLKFRREAQELKSFLQGTPEEDNYLKCFKMAEEDLSSKPIFSSPQSEFDYCNSLDLLKIKDIRRQNYSKVEALINSLKFKKLPGEYAFLILDSDDRESLKSYLHSEKIYCPIHWPDSKDVLSRNLLSIPIDQRVTDDHIALLTLALTKFCATRQIYNPQQ